VSISSSSLLRGREGIGNDGGKQKTGGTFRREEKNTQGSPSSKCGPEYFIFRLFANNAPKKIVGEKTSKISRRLDNENRVCHCGEGLYLKNDGV